MNLPDWDVVMIVMVIFLAYLIVWLARWEKDLRNARCTIEILRRGCEALNVRVADLQRELLKYEEAEIAYYEQETEDEPAPEEPLPF